MAATFDQTVDHLRILSVLDRRALVDPQIGQMWSPMRQRAIDRMYQVWVAQLDLPKDPWSSVERPGVR